MSWFGGLRAHDETNDPRAGGTVPKKFLECLAFILALVN